MSGLLLEEYLRRLRLPTARRRYQELEQQARAESWSYGEYLERLAAEELADRQERRIAQASRKAGFPFLKTLEEFDFTFQTSINALRQKEHAVIKAGCQQLGIDLTLKTVDAGVFFSSSPGNPDTVSHFYTDLEMFTSTVPNPAPVSYMRRWSSVDPKVDIPQKSNSWSGFNYTRWENADFNKLYQQALTEVDLSKLDTLVKQMNDLVVTNYVTVGLVDRKSVDARATWLEGPDVGVFDANTWNIADWTKKS